MAANPGIAKPESQRKECFDFAFILSFAKRGSELKRYTRVIKDCSRRKARKVVASIISKYKPDYISLVHKYAHDKPELILERGDKKLVDEWLQKKGGE
ncbi:hypothetical protein KJ934_00625 [Patescibacteria group bacterium]|nr:hypothetical protein [Patescibacteria group bacterium]MBU4353584.1 hypothetical protein [Patescibacteria group bacterium]MCG2699072.1 hypothetical protein [Candidatus Parcubacteria bacterium]